jgi:hypothetical protein
MVASIAMITSIVVIGATIGIVAHRSNGCDAAPSRRRRYQGVQEAWTSDNTTVAAATIPGSAVAIGGVRCGSWRDNGPEYGLAPGKGKKSK